MTRLRIGIASAAVMSLASQLADLVIAWIDKHVEAKKR